MFNTFLIDHMKIDLKIIYCPIILSYKRNDYRMFYKTNIVQKAQFFLILQPTHNPSEQTRRFLQEGMYDIED